MKKMNKKGFTLIELLAVIVVLAIVMVIATQKITDVVNSSRSNAFILSYKSVVKQVKDTYTMGDDPTCTDEDACLKKYDVTAGDYSLTVKNYDATNSFEITLTAKDGGKFKNLDLTKYGDAAGKDQSGKTICDFSKIDNTAKDCGSLKNDGRKGIKGYVAK